MECPIYTRLKRRSPHAPRELEREHLAERGGASLLVWPLNTHRKLVTTAGAQPPQPHEVARRGRRAPTCHGHGALPWVNGGRHKRHRPGMQPLGIGDDVRKLDHGTCSLPCRRPGGRRSEQQKRRAACSPPGALFHVATQAPHGHAPRAATYLRTTLTTAAPAATDASGSTVISTASNSALLETASTTQSL